ncbi:MAG: hypothetical protein ACLQBL_03880 [Polyangiaceae bacterium]
MESVGANGVSSAAAPGGCTVSASSVSLRVAGLLALVLTVVVINGGGPPV